MTTTPNRTVVVMLELHPKMRWKGAGWQLF